jgi:hypothetical protein
MKIKYIKTEDNAIYFTTDKADRLFILTNGRLYCFFASKYDNNEFYITKRIKTQTNDPTKVEKEILKFEKLIKKMLKNYNTIKTLFPNVKTTTFIQQNYSIPIILARPPTQLLLLLDFTEFHVELEKITLIVYFERDWLNNETNILKTQYIITIQPPLSEIIKNKINDPELKISKHSDSIYIIKEKKTSIVKEEDLKEILSIIRKVITKTALSIIDEIIEKTERVIK